MMKNNRKNAWRYLCMLLMLTVVAVTCITACTKDETKDEEPAITKVDDLAGKKIGVQLGTTGDIYASDYEEQGSTVEREWKSFSDRGKS